MVEAVVVAQAQPATTRSTLSRVAMVQVAAGSAATSAMVGEILPPNQLTAAAQAQTPVVHLEVNYMVDLPDTFIQPDDSSASAALQVVRDADVGGQAQPAITTGQITQVRKGSIAGQAQPAASRWTLDGEHMMQLHAQAGQATVSVRLSDVHVSNVAAWSGQPEAAIAGKVRGGEVQAGAQPATASMDVQRISVLEAD